MSIVYQRDKRSGITYAYESKAWWDKEKKQSRSKRKLIGRLDEETGEIVPTDGRCRKKPKPAEDPITRTETVPFVITSHSYYGATYLLDAIGDKLGITTDLKTCFPDIWHQILSIVYYLIMEENNPLNRFEKWGRIHKHPYGKDISLQNCNDLFSSITNESREHFFRLQKERRMEKEYWAYDITTISSYSEAIEQSRFGKSREPDKLPQLNFALAFGEKSGLPFYYRRLSRSLHDGKTVKNLLTDLDVIEVPGINLITDWSFNNIVMINSLYKEHLKFLIAAGPSVSFIKPELDKVFDKIRIFTNYDANLRVYTYTVKTEWNSVVDKERIYIHLYYSIEQEVEDEKSLRALLADLEEELVSGDLVDTHEKQYKKYFNIKESPQKSLQIIPKEEAVKRARRYCGYFALITNENMDAKKALKLYRDKEVAEKAFGNLKDRLNMRRMRGSADQSLEGKLFVQFIALIFLSYISKQMQEQGIYKDFTIQQVLDKLDVIECFEYPGHELRVGEILEKQKELYVMLGAKPPDSL